MILWRCGSKNATCPASAGGRIGGGRIGGGLRAAFGLALALLLTVCADPAPPTKWVKAGVDDRTIERELEDCVSQASIARAREEGINQDISATLGRNWQMGQTTAIVDQSMRRQASGLADSVLNACMRSKGFSREG